MVIDVICYNGEKDLFQLRYEILKDYVDEFIVVEFDKTFSGRSKLPYFDLDFKDLKDPKIKYFHISEDTYSKYRVLAISSPNTEYGKGAEHWIREFCQKESIKDCLTHLQDDDIVFISDCDEIWNPELIKWQKETSSFGSSTDFLLHKIYLKVYTYYLNNRSSEVFAGTIMGYYKYIKDRCLNHLRTNAMKIASSEGWHFTSLKDNLKHKLEDSYTSESYATEAVMQNLENNVANNKDFLGRDFTYKVDESEWPEYLKSHRQDYQHLLK